MRCLWRNKRPFYYSQYLGLEPILDKDGYETGEYRKQYSEPVLMKGNVHDVHDVRTGLEVTPYGVSGHYDLTIILEDENCPIDENSLLYIFVEPGEGVKPDFRVRKVSRSLNGVTYAISKVTAS